ncbi:INSulin related [Caenorhabditis elegans]|uniref:INSulin related n=1 Tax=Caenorhabditis elegans TaxID=6239 RepID=Q9U1P6_CAEEL|nr:INSulin related [Caenorhabditis elegans]CAB04964.3 INSulin related [Caenorhabditis elegans]|eukprot:NP_493443.2 INSulin related [Caenorhabditis elegans]
MRSPTLFLLLLLVPLALCHVFSEPADLELKSYQALEKSLKEMGLIRANQGPQKACGRSMMMKVQKLCAGGCTIQNDDLTIKSCSTGYTDAGFISACCPSGFVF